MNDSAVLYARMYGMTYHEAADLFGISLQEANRRARSALKVLEENAGVEAVTEIQTYHSRLPNQ